jgi:hypothetical protein
VTAPLVDQITALREEIKALFSQNSNVSSPLAIMGNTDKELKYRVFKKNFAMVFRMLLCGECYENICT